MKWGPRNSATECLGVVGVLYLLQNQGSFILHSVLLFNSIFVAKRRSANFKISQLTWKEHQPLDTEKPCFGNHPLDEPSSCDLATLLRIIHPSWTKSASMGSCVFSRWVLWFAGKQRVHFFGENKTSIKVHSHVVVYQFHVKPNPFVYCVPIVLKTKASGHHRLIFEYMRDQRFKIENGYQG